MGDYVEASCPGCNGTGDQGGNPSYGACDDCEGSGKVKQPLPMRNPVSDDLVERLLQRELAILGLEKPTPRNRADASLFREAASQIAALSAERDALVAMDGLAKRKLDGLLERGWKVCGYAIRQDGDYGLVTDGALVGWFSVAKRNAAAAEARATAAEAQLKAAREALKPFAEAVFNDNGDMTVNRGVPTYDDFIRAYFAHRAALNPKAPS